MKKNKSIKNTPLKNVENKTIATEIEKENNKKAGFRIFVATLAVILVSMLFGGRNAGMSGDEGYHLKHAKAVLDFYRTFGEDTVAYTVGPLSSAENSREYGQTPDNLSELIASVFNFEDILFVRHIVNIIFGWLGILFASLLAYHISKKWYAAILTALILFLSPRYLGHSFNNLKDIPFAAMMMMGVYYISRFLDSFPKPSIKTMAMLALSIGLAIGIRVGGLLLIAYFAVFAVSYLAYQWFLAYQNQKGKKTLALFGIEKQLYKMFFYGIVVSLAGYLIAVLIWPYALVSPISNVYTAFSKMSHFEISIRQNFEGIMQWSSGLPWYYTPKFILITIPIAVIVGVILYFFTGGLKKEKRFTTFLLYFAFIFPIFWITYTKANVYGGWRHSLFAYPPMAAAAALGFSGLIDLAKNKYLKIIFIALPFILLIKPLIHIVKNHPYEYVYFNELIGGIKGAYGNYEMDYYYHSTREASEWILKNADRSHLKPGEKIKVVSWHTASVEYFFRKDTADFKIDFSRWYERGNNDWDYAIFTITGMNPGLIKNRQAFPPKNTDYQIKVDGYPICIVLKRTDKSDFYGSEALKRNDVETAKAYLRKALEVDPNNEQAIENLIQVYTYTQQMDSVAYLVNHWISVDPTNTSALYQKANLYYMAGDFKNAIMAGQMISKYNSGDISGLWIVANAQVQMNDLQGAMDNLNTILQTRGDFKPAYMLMAQIYQKVGNNEQAQQIIQAAQQLP